MEEVTLNPTDDVPEFPPETEEEASGDPRELRRRLMKQESRIRQLRLEIVSRHEENDRIIAENLRQNEELRRLNLGLDQKIKERTQELQESKELLEMQNHEVTELAESKDAMMHMIVHDMKNPLTSVMGALCLAQNRRFDIDPTLRELLLDAHVQSIKLRTMIDDILTISQMRSKEFQVQTVPVEMISLIQQSVMLMNTTKGPKEVTLRFDPQTGEVVADIDYPVIERVLNNLINNALKYAPPKSEIEVGLAAEPDWVRVSIANRGEAIPAAAHEKIFELFGRAKPEEKAIQGTGLGLAFCKLAVESHGGTIGVESPLPGTEIGARFEFTLPRHRETN